MEKTELLKLMNKEQLVKVVNSMIDENKILKNQRRASESQSVSYTHLTLPTSDLV